MAISKWSDERASITLESAIILPILIIIIFSFFVVIERIQTEFHLRSSVSTAVKLVALHVYPIREANTHLLQTKYGQQIQNISTSMQTLSELMPFFKSNFANTKQSVLSELFTPYVQRFVDEKALNKNNVKVTRVILPDLSNGKQATFSIRVSYTYVTLLKQKLKIELQASERAWIGNGLTERNISANPVRILSIEPNPVRRGTFALIKATAPAGSHVSITIRYKSGTSIAKGLASKMADERGNVSWQWKVGGNTTPGVWQITVNVASYSDVMYFEVFRK